MLTRLRCHPLTTIRARLTLWYVALLAATLVLFSAALYVSLAYQVSSDFDRALLSEAKEGRDYVNVHRGTAALMSDRVRVDKGSVVALYSRRGSRLIAQSPEHRPLPFQPQLPDDQVSEPHFYTVRDASGQDWRQLVLPVVSADRVVALLLYARPLTEVQAVLWRLALLMSIAVPLTLLFATAGGLFLAGRALGPIDRITRTVQRIDANGLAERLNLSRANDEVGRLAATFDQMLGRIQSAFEQQRRFTADASHELRTPLAIMASQVEVALSRPRKSSEYRAVLASLAEDIQRVSGLIGQLLLLARAEAGQVPLERQPLDLGVLADAVVGSLAPLADRAGVSLRGERAGAVWVSGDRARLTQLIANLVDNALRYTPAGGEVVVAVVSEWQRAALRVADTGEGIPAAALPRVFDRFYRVDSARSRGAGGAGLGLAICRWITEAHGGEIGVESDCGRGTTFTVWLPTIAPPTAARGEAEVLEVAPAPPAMARR